MSPDPYRNSGGPGDPGSWNRYGYVGGDPINKVDPGGMCAQDTNTSVNVCASVGSDGTGGNGGTDNQGMQIVNDTLQSVDTQGGTGVPDNFFDPTGRFNQGNQIQLSDVTTAHSVLNNEIAGLSANCQKVLPAAQTLLADAKDMTFYDGKALAHAPVSVFLPGYTSNTFGMVVGDNYAVTVRVPNSPTALSSNIVLGSMFFNAGSSRQGLTLLHELLHYATQMDDQQFDAAYGIFGRAGETASSALTNWLSHDCQN
jgi:hypothetical protein